MSAILPLKYVPFLRGYTIHACTCMYHLLVSVAYLCVLNLIRERKGEIEEVKDGEKERGGEREGERGG